MTGRRRPLADTIAVSCGALLLAVAALAAGDLHWPVLGALGITVALTLPGYVFVTRIGSPADWDVASLWTVRAVVSGALWIILCLLLAMVGVHVGGRWPLLIGAALILAVGLGLPAREGDPSGASGHTIISGLALLAVGDVAVAIALIAIHVAAVGTSSADLAVSAGRVGAVTVSVSSTRSEPLTVIATDASGNSRTDLDVRAGHREQFDLVPPGGGCRDGFTLTITDAHGHPAGDPVALSASFARQLCAG